MASSFLLELFLHSFPVTYWAHISFHIVHGVLKARILKWFAIPFSSGPRFVRIFHHDPVGLGWPYMAWLSFIELDTTVVL